MKQGMVYSGMSVRVISALLITVGLLYFSLPVRSLADQSDGIVEESCGEENVNGKKVLIAYDSKHGSTALVARQIADVLCICGYQVDISRARKVEDVTLYDAVVAGSPIYWAKFLPGTQLFLKNHEQTLATMPVALFALSTYADEETGLVRDEVKGFFVDKELEKVPGINPLGEIGLFGGTFTLRTLFPVEAFSMKLENYSDSNYLNEEVVITWAENLCILFE
jgi:menaquinone-dependent protoporphyrinogen IX oxidase